MFSAICHKFSNQNHPCLYTNSGHCTTNGNGLGYILYIFIGIVFILIDQEPALLYVA